MSSYGIAISKKGMIVSVEWVGILAENGDLRTDYKKRTAPFLCTTFKQTNTKVFIRNKFQGLEWKLVDKNNNYSVLLKKENYFTPCIGISTK